MVFQMKYNSEGRVKCLKGWLVAQGFSQKYSIHYDEFFLLLLISPQFALHLHSQQMDVVDTYMWKGGASLQN